MTGSNIKEQIAKLIALQQIDGQIYAVKKELKNRPALLADLQQQFEAKKGRLKSLEEKVKSLQLSRKGLEGDLKAQEEAIVKANAQLSQLKTNKEYHAKLTEIEGFKGIKSQVEEKILLSYDEGDNIQKQIDQEKASLAEEEKEFLAAKKEIEDVIRTNEEQVRGLNAQRARGIEGIDKATLQRYERILVNKDGLAIVPLQNGVCGGCFMNVPPQVINEIKMNERMVYCEMCARILYLEDNLS